METLTAVQTEQNIAIVQDAFANFLRGNIGGIVDVSTDDITWGSFDNPTVPYAGNFHGKKGVAEFFSTLGNAVNYTDFQTNKFFADKDMVFVEGFHKGIVKSTGKTYGHNFLMQFRLRGGKICSFFAWVDSRDQAAAFVR